MTERIKYLRKHLGLTQAKFAEKIGSMQNTVANYETGRRTPSSQTIVLICKTFNISEQWLRTGAGEMFATDIGTREEQISAALGALSDGENSDFKFRFVKMLAGLSESDWLLLEKMALEIAGHAISNEHNRIDEEVESYRQELLAEQKGAERSDPSADTNKNQA